MSRRLTTPELVRKIGTDWVLLVLSVFFLLENISEDNKFWCVIFGSLSTLTITATIRDCHYWRNPK